MKHKMLFLLCFIIFFCCSSNYLVINKWSFTNEKSDVYNNKDLRNNPIIQLDKYTIIYLIRKKYDKKKNEAICYVIYQKNKRGYMVSKDIWPEVFNNEKEAIEKIYELPGAYKLKEEKENLLQEEIKNVQLLISELKETNYKSLTEKISKMKIENILLKINGKWEGIDLRPRMEPYDKSKDDFYGYDKFELNLNNFKLIFNMHLTGEFDYIFNIYDIIYNKKNKILIFKYYSPDTPFGIINEFSIKFLNNGNINFNLANCYIEEFKQKSSSINVTSPNL